MTYDLRPISPHVGRPSWEDRFPKEERGMTMADLLRRIMARWLAATSVDLTDDQAVIRCLFEGRFLAAEIARHYPEAQRLAIGLRVAGKVAA